MLQALSPLLAGLLSFGSMLKYNGGGGEAEMGGGSQKVLTSSYKLIVLGCNVQGGDCSEQ